MWPIVQMKITLTRLLSHSILTPPSFPRVFMTRISLLGHLPLLSDLSPLSCMVLIFGIFL